MLKHRGSSKTVPLSSNDYVGTLTTPKACNTEVILQLDLSNWRDDLCYAVESRAAEVSTAAQMRQRRASAAPAGPREIATMPPSTTMRCIMLQGCYARLKASSCVFNPC